MGIAVLLREIDRWLTILVDFRAFEAFCKLQLSTTRPFPSRIQPFRPVADFALVSCCQVSRDSMDRRNRVQCVRHPRPLGFIKVRPVLRYFGENPQHNRRHFSPLLPGGNPSSSNSSMIARPQCPLQPALPMPLERMEFELVCVCWCE